MSHSTEHVGGCSENLIVPLVHGVRVILAVFNTIPNNDGASLRTCFDGRLHCVAEPSMRRLVSLSFFFQQEAPKKTLREHGFTFDKDWVHADLLSKSFGVLQKVEAHLFICIGDFDTTRLFCCEAQAVLCHMCIFGTHPMRAVGDDLVYGVLFNGETHLFIWLIPKVALICSNNLMFRLTGFVW